mgnify:CR=1 FL=1
MEPKVEGASALGVADSVVAEAALSFLGLGQQPPGAGDVARGGLEVLEEEGRGRRHPLRRGHELAGIDDLVDDVAVDRQLERLAHPGVLAERCLRALAVAGTKRSLVLPDVPSLAETLKGYDGSTWFAIFAPAGTPNDIIDRHASELAKIMARKDVIDQLLQQGYEPWVMGPMELGAYVKEQIAKWAKVIKVAGIKGE